MNLTQFSTVQNVFRVQLQQPEECRLVELVISLMINRWEDDGYNLELMYFDCPASTQQHCTALTFMGLPYQYLPSSGHNLVQADQPQPVIIAE